MIFADLQIGDRFIKGSVTEIAALYVKADGLNNEHKGNAINLHTHCTELLDGTAPVIKIV